MLGCAALSSNLRTVPRHMIKLAVDEPTRGAMLTKAQWWSNPARHVPHSEQCLARAGFQWPSHLPFQQRFTTGAS
jgi:hypothetical protein